MAGRPMKAGLDYFELDCHMEEKVRLIQAEFGYKSFAIVVKLYQKIYGECGYYCEWHEDSLLLFMSELGVSSCEEKNYITEVVQACIRRNIFSRDKYEKYGVLTSVGVQKRYFAAVARRESVEVKKEYLLLSDDKIPINVRRNSINVDRNSINVDRNSQRREEKSREENISPLPPLRKFEEFLSAYPKKVKARQIVETAYCKLLADDVHLTEDMLITSAQNYAEAVRILGTQERYAKNPQNFLRDCAYMEYLPENYVKPEKPKGKNSFTDFKQNDYDFDEILQKVRKN